MSLGAGDLHRLAKTLRHIAVEATSEANEDVTPADVLVGTDLFTHSPTTVTDVARRTGIVQSQVSRIVAQLQADGIVSAQRDPKDGRRTLLMIEASARRQFGLERGDRDPRAAIAQHLADRNRPHDEDDVAQVIDLLEQLQTRLK